MKTRGEDEGVEPGGAAVEGGAAGDGVEVGEGEEAAGGELEMGYWGCCPCFDERSRNQSLAICQIVHLFRNLPHYKPPSHLIFRSIKRTAQHI